MTTPPQMPAGSARSAVILGITVAIIGLFFFPEIFDSITILLGAYAWRSEPGNRGLAVVIIGIVFMIVGIYITAFYSFAYY